MTTHADEARRIVDEFVRGWLKSEQPVGTTQERLAAVIAAALAAAERRGIERAAEVVDKAGRVVVTVGVPMTAKEAERVSILLPVYHAIRALLPAEPAAKCARCNGSGVTSAPYELDAEDCPSCGGAR